jgi:hypothetical protein
MKAFNPLTLLLLLVTQSIPTQAADLSGAWAIDTATCSRIFTTENNKLAFKPDADLDAGGVIIQGKQITGTMQKCRVKSLHDDGSNVQVKASCSDGVAVSDVTFDVKITGGNKMTVSSKTPTPVEMLYVRCSL